MKTLKISLAIIVIVAIGAGIFFWLIGVKEPEKVKAPENLFTAKIEQEIEKLKAKSAMSFCKEFYNEIELQINDFYKQGRFGNNQLENDQWKENLEKTLYSVYADKFIKQAFYVFSKQDWEYGDLKFIQAEKNKLKKSKFLESDSPVAKEFAKIQNVLDKYNEIVRFISSCNSFAYSGNNLSDRFPIGEVQEKIKHATRLRNNNLENTYVNNCTRLHNGLREIPQSLFRKHIRYLDNKIDNWSDMYPNYISQSDYSNNLYKPIKSEIEGLDNDIYKVSNFENEYYRLIQKWSNDNTKAYNFNYNTNTNE